VFALSIRLSGFSFYALMSLAQADMVSRYIRLGGTDPSFPTQNKHAWRVMR